MNTKKIKYRRLPYDKAKLITTAVRVKDGGATTVPTAKAIALRVNGKWETEATALPRGASVPVYRCVDGGAPAAASKAMWQYLADIAERNLARCGELLVTYGKGEIHAAHIRRVQECAAKYAASLAACRSMIVEYAKVIKANTETKCAERERKEEEIVRNGSSAYVDAAAEKAGERYNKIKARVNRRAMAKAANAVKAA
jgi:hypothetical protein